MEKNTKRRLFLKAAGIGSLAAAFIAAFPVKNLFAGKIGGNEQFSAKSKVKINPSAVKRIRGERS